MYITNYNVKIYEVGDKITLRQSYGGIPVGTVLTVVYAALKTVTVDFSGSRRSGVPTAYIAGE